MIAFGLLISLSLSIWICDGARLPRVGLNPGHQQSYPLECHRADDYSTQWFLDHAKPEFSQPLLNNALFYSAGMSKVAREVAESTSRITIWDVWPCYLYNHLDHEDNPLRCIHHSDEERQTFFGHMSRAFAMKAHNFSTVLHSSANYQRPPTNGIWGSVEFPTLQEGGVVDFIEKMNESNSLSEIFWSRSKDLVSRLKNAFAGLEVELKRRGNNGGRRNPPPLPPGFHGSCRSRKELEFFDDMNW